MNKEEKLKDIGFNVDTNNFISYSYHKGNDNNRVDLNILADEDKIHQMLLQFNADILNITFEELDAYYETIINNLLKIKETHKKFLVINKTTN